MLRYLNHDIVFQEVPDEVSLAINLTGCPCRCPGCHSPFLWTNEGELLTSDVLDSLIAACHQAITCVALMGGDAEPTEVDRMARHIRENHPQLRVAWYSGRSLLPPTVSLHHFDYVKLGPFLQHLGALRSRRTNQRFYKVTNGTLADITARFWQK